MSSSGMTMWLKDVAFTGATLPEPGPTLEPDEIVVNGIQPINPQSGVP